MCSLRHFLRTGNNLRGDELVLLWAHKNRSRLDRTKYPRFRSVLQVEFEPYPVQFKMSTRMLRLILTISRIGVLHGRRLQKGRPRENNVGANWAHLTCTSPLQDDSTIDVILRPMKAHLEVIQAQYVFTSISVSSDCTESYFSDSLTSGLCGQRWIFRTGRGIEHGPDRMDPTFHEDTN